MKQRAARGGQLFLKHKKGEPWICGRQAGISKPIILDMRNGFWNEKSPCDALERILLGPGMDASIFLHGVCGIFALALNERYGYKIEVAAEEPEDDLPWEDRIVHIYCRQESTYIDVRGAIDDKDEFLSEFDDFFVGGADCFPVQEKELKDFVLTCMTESEYSAFKKYADGFLDTFGCYGGQEKI